jgi:N-acetylmuramoyl-L-alanine amidase
MKVLIDIGHGGTDNGAAANELIEKDLNLKVGLLIKAYLSDYQCDIKLTRETDTTLTADQRVAIAKAYNPTLCVSVHHNAAADPNARGSEVIHAHYDEYDDKLALDIMQRLSVDGMPKRRSFTKLNDNKSDWYYMIRRIWDNDTDAIITEGGFLTNKADADLLRTEAFLNAEAKAIVESIIEYLKLKPKAHTEEQVTESAIDKLHRLQIITSPTYWKNKSKTGEIVPGEWVAILIRKMSDYLG